MFNRVVIIILFISLLYVGFNYYQIRKYSGLMQNKIDTQAAELQIKTLEIANLTQSINEQNKAIAQYKINSEQFNKQISELNSYLDIEAQKQFVLEESPANTCEESIQWLKKIQSSVQF